MDVRHSFAAEDLRFNSLELFENDTIIPNLKAQTIGCKDFTCMIVAQILHDGNVSNKYKQFKLIKLSDLDKFLDGGPIVSIQTITDDYWRG